MKKAKQRTLMCKQTVVPFIATPSQFDRFAHQLDNAPAPGPKLRSLLRRQPAWQKTQNGF